MNKEIVLAGKVLTPEGIIEAGVVRVSGGIIESIEERAAYSGSIDLDVGERMIAPGFIDIHIHGAVGHHFMTSDRDGIEQILQYHMRHGTTGLLATTSTADRETIDYTLSAAAKIMEDQRTGAAKAGASIRGVHLEGPYLNPVRCGAQNADCLRLADVGEYKEWEKSGVVRMITIAPEMPGSEPLVRYICGSSPVLVSAGHTDASYEQIEAAAKWGLSHFTHFTNAMRGFKECEPGVFEPGVFGAGLLLRETTVELIADGIHVHPKNLELIYRTKGADHVALITDAVPYCGMPDGVYKKSYGDRKGVVVGNGSVRMEENGGLAGSALTMNRAARQMASLGIPLTDVWTMASAVPARLIGEGERKGRIRPGMDADLIVIDDQFNVLCTMIEGRVGYADAELGYASAPTHIGG
ncbi:MAG: N-acetylglucosamine-6-phosphate deacetylase [Paenibacillus sp.]|nr:N-acetylglucosamine-6-phosphate deacetylase [Paenibacillus sp.]